MPIGCFYGHLQTFEIRVNRICNSSLDVSNVWFHFFLPWSAVERGRKKRTEQSNQLSSSGPKTNLNYFCWWRSSSTQKIKMSVFFFTELRLKSWGMGNLYRFVCMFCCVNTSFSWCHLFICEMCAMKNFVGFFGQNTFWFITREKKTRSGVLHVKI